MARRRSRVQLPQVPRFQGVDGSGRATATSWSHGLLAHLVERLPRKQEARGSSPRWSTYSGIEEDGNPPVSGTGQTGFDPRGPDVVQRVVAQHGESACSGSKRPRVQVTPARPEARGMANPPVLGTGQTQFDSAVSDHGSLAETD